MPSSLLLLSRANALWLALASWLSWARGSWLVANAIPRVLGLDYRTPASANERGRGCAASRVSLPALIQRGDYGVIIVNAHGTSAPSVGLPFLSDRVFAVAAVCRWPACSDGHKGRRVRCRWI